MNEQLKKDQLEKLEDKPKPVKRRSTIKKFIIGFVTTFIISILLQSFIVVTRVADEKWAEYDCEYDIQYEFFFSSLITTYIDYLEKSGYDENSILIRTLRKTDNIIYQRVKKKIPKDDLMWAIFSFDAELEPILTKGHLENPEIYAPQILEALRIFATMATKVPLVDRYGRYAKGYSLLTFFFNNDTSPTLFKIYKNWMPDVITYSSLLISKMGDAKELFDDKKLEFVPFLIVDRALMANYYYLKLTQQFDCQSREVKNMQEYINKLFSYIPTAAGI